MILSSDLGTCDIEPQAWSYFPDKACLELLVCVELMAALFLDEHKLEEQEPQIFRLCLSFSVLGSVRYTVATLQIYGYGWPF